MTRLAISSIGRELLDRPDADPAAVGVSLRNIGRANRWLGGLAAVRFGLARLLARRPAGDTLSLLDVGTGMGDVPRMVRPWAAARGLRVRVLGLDLSPVAARLATAAGIPTAIGSGGDLPLRDRAVDVVVTSQVAHHLDRDSGVVLLRECARVARLGGVVADLHRSRSACAGYWLASHLLRFDPHTRADGLTSLRRGYTSAELAELIARAGLRARVYRRAGARLVAVWSAGP